MAWNSYDVFLSDLNWQQSSSSIQENTGPNCSIEANDGSGEKKRHNIAVIKLETVISLSLASCSGMFWNCGELEPSDLATSKKPTRKFQTWNKLHRSHGCDRTWARPKATPRRWPYGHHAINLWIGNCRSVRKFLPWANGLMWLTSKTPVLSCLLTVIVSIRAPHGVVVDAVECNWLPINLRRC